MVFVNQQINQLTFVHKTLYTDISWTVLIIIKPALVLRAVMPNHTIHNCLCRLLNNLPSTPLDNIRVMVIVWRLRGNIIRTTPCWVVWHNVHGQQHTHMSSSYRPSRLGLSHWDPYTMHRGGCLELYYCNMVEWSWWDLSLIWKTNWFPSVLWHCWFGHMTCKIVPDMTYNVFGGTLNLAQSISRWTCETSFVFCS